MECGLLQSLLFFLKLFPRDTELALNISRILSKMTLCTDVCLHLLRYRRRTGDYDAVADNDDDDLFSSLFAVLTIHVQKADLVVRVLFVLGNLTAKSDEARARLWLLGARKEAEKGAADAAASAPVRALVTTFSKYVDLMAGELMEAEGEEGKEPSKVEDVLIKLVRFVFL